MADPKPDLELPSHCHTQFRQILITLNGNLLAGDLMPSRRELANAIRALSMDAVQQANSGHPGAPMGLADIAQVLWGDFFKSQPSKPRMGEP